MPHYPLVRFTAGPSIDADVRFDFNEAGEWATDAGPEADGWSIGVPSFTGEPGGVGAEYGYRRLEFTFNVRGERFAALRTHSRLAREVLRADNWLLFQLDAFSKPVWFKTYRTEPGGLSFDRVYDGKRSDEWQIGCAFDADPFAYGERVTLDPVTIANDPAAASNPCHVVLPEIEGDAPTNLRVEVNPSNDQTYGGYKWLLRSTASEAAAVAPVVWQVGDGDGWTTGADTGGATISGAQYCGGSAREITFSTNAGLAHRIFGEAPSTLVPGRYRAFVRVERQGASDATYELELGQKVFLSWYFDSPVARMDRAPSDASHATWVDLGTISLPRGAQAPHGEAGPAVTPEITLRVARLSGSAALRLDAFLLVPLDAPDVIDVRSLTADHAEFGIRGGDGVGIYDGDVERMWFLTGIGDQPAGAPTLLAGGFPVAHPGVKNSLTLLQQVNGPAGQYDHDSSDEVSATTEVTVSYHPRYLYIGGE